MKRLHALPFLLLIFCLPTAYSATCSRPIRVAAVPVGSSFTVSPTQEIGGAYPAMLARIARETGCRFEYIHMPVVRAHVMLKAGEVDLIPITVQTAERDREGEFIATSKNRLLVIYLKKRPLPWKSLNELRDANDLINVVRGQNFGPVFAQWLSDPRTRTHLEEVTTTDQIAQKLLAGRADAVVIPLGGFAGSISKYGMQAQIGFNQLSDVPPLILGSYLAKKGLPAADRKQLRTALQEKVKSGEYYRLLKAHYPAWALPAIEPMH